MLAEAGHGVVDAGVDRLDQLGHEGQGLDVAGRDPARVCPQDAPGERGILGILDCLPRPVRCQAMLTLLARSAACLSWVPGVWSRSSAMAFMSPRPSGRAGSVPGPAVVRSPRGR
jgi:hypothetical protein